MIAGPVREIARTCLLWAAVTAIMGVLALLALFALLVVTLVAAFGNHGLWFALNAFLGVRPDAGGELT